MFKNMIAGILIVGALFGTGFYTGKQVEQNKNNKLTIEIQKKVKEEQEKAKKVAFTRMENIRRNKDCLVKKVDNAWVISESCFDLYDEIIENYKK